MAHQTREPTMNDEVNKVLAGLGGDAVSVWDTLAGSRKPLTARKVKGRIYGAKLDEVQAVLTALVAAGLVVSEAGEETVYSVR